jgi:hypothetical protein
VAGICGQAVEALAFRQSGQRGRGREKAVLVFALTTARQLFEAGAAWR